MTLRQDLAASAEGWRQNVSAHGVLSALERNRPALGNEAVSSCSSISVNGAEFAAHRKKASNVRFGPSALNGSLRDLSMPSQANLRTRRGNVSARRRTVGSAADDLDSEDARYATAGAMTGTNLRQN